MPPCCQCNSGAAAAALASQQAQVDAATAALPAPAPNGTCSEFRANRRAFLEANPSRNPGLRPRRGTNYRKPDPCEETLDDETQRLLDQLNTAQGESVDGCGERVCRVPSIFRALTDREAVEDCFANGFIDQLPNETTQSRGVGGICTAGLGGGGAEKRYAQLCTRSRNLLQRPYSFCRKPSLFTATNDREQAALCVELGFTDALPNQQQREYSARCTQGLGGGRGPGDKTFSDLCVRVTRFGPSSAGL